MKQPSCVTRLTSALLLIACCWIAGAASPVLCQEARRVHPEAEAQLITQSWVPTSNLNTARTGHTATLLPNGKVLVVGGLGIDPYPRNVLDTAELYDPATGRWSATGRLNAAKSGHTATLLPNGRVLVVGQAHSATEGVEIYDPSTGKWSLVSSGTNIWRDHTATLLKNGSVLLAGGWANPYSSYIRAALYDPATDSWSSTGSLMTLRGAGHQATLLLDGRVLVTGGTNDADFLYPLSDAELYDPVTGTWSRVSSLNIARHSHSATMLPNGTVLIAGGFGPPTQVPPGCASFPCTIYDTPTSSAELFDPATGQWSNTGALNAARVGHTAISLANGEVLVAGGYTITPPGPGGDIKKAERYEASGALWRDTSDLNTARSSHTSTLLPNGNVLVAGGVNTGGILSSSELYGVFPSGTIGPGFTGAWYDPAQSGHGIFVQILSNQRFYAAWFAFNPAGTQQAWFTGVGTYSGDTASITAVEQPSGGRWIPNFDPSQIERKPWGTLTFTFIDCDHGTVDFNSVMGYGTGTMNLTRLTQPAGLSCQ